MGVMDQGLSPAQRVRSWGELIEWRLYPTHCGWQSNTSSCSL